jgi:glycosyltransferase involved in cell wall biosynthesis
MNILILSWRDIKHPYGGGAELLVHEMAKRWAEKGHKVLHYSAYFPGARRKETIDGVKYLRDGNWYNVHIKGFINLLRGRLGKPDVILDEVHGIPFFAAMYTKTPVVCLACEVAKDVWDQMYPFPINIIGKVVELVYLFLYRNLKFITISNSTRSDLVNNRIKKKNVTVVPMGFTYSLPDKLPPKEKKPTFIFLGRLAKSKGVPDAIKAFSNIAKKLPNSKMWIVGKGERVYEKKLVKLVKKLKLEKSVEFKGFVSLKKKFELLAKAHLILVPSVREGWGLIVPEANVVGTPAIVYNVPGLKDVTINGTNGVIVNKNSIKSLADESIKLLKDKKRFSKLSKSSRKYAKLMNWDNTAKVALNLLEKVVKDESKS